MQASKRRAPHRWGGGGAYPVATSSRPRVTRELQCGGKGGDMTTGLGVSSLFSVFCLSVLPFQSWEGICLSDSKCFLNSTACFPLAALNTLDMCGRMYSILTPPPTLPVVMPGTREKITQEILNKILALNPFMYYTQEKNTTGESV